MPKAGEFYYAADWRDGLRCSHPSQTNGRCPILIASQSAATLRD